VKTVSKIDLRVPTSRNIIFTTDNALFYGTTKGP